MQIAIIADDLTGATDAAAVFCGPGRQVEVGLTLDAGLASDVAVIDAASRELPAEDAAQRVTFAIGELKAQRPIWWYKKVDSTLRGHVDAELAAFTAAVDPDLTIFAPAYPAQKRITVNGVQRYAEQLAPVDGARSDLRGLLSSLSLPETLITLSELHGGVGLLSRLLAGLPSQALCICDAVDDRDLDTLVSAALDCERRVAWSGSAGLAAALARHAYGPPFLEAPPFIDTGQVVVVVGTLQAASRAQLAALEREASLSVVRLEVHPEEAIHPETLALAASTARNLLGSGGSIAIATAESPLIPSSQRLASLLGGFVANLVREFGIQRLALTGGEIARAVCQELGVTRLYLLGQVAEGMPASVTLNGVREIDLVTKAGGFGDVDALTLAYQYLLSEEDA